MSDETQEAAVAGEKNPGRYRDMSHPHDSAAAAREAFMRFHEEVVAARIKHRMADVHVIVMYNYRTEDGDEAQAIANAHLGNSLLAESMCAFAYGREKKERDEAIAKAVRGEVRRATK